MEEVIGCTPFIYKRVEAGKNGSRLHEIFHQAMCPARYSSCSFLNAAPESPAPLSEFFWLAFH
jgi:hypothetical protein